MGDNKYTRYWETVIPEIIEQLSNDQRHVTLSVEGLREYGDRQSYYSNFRIIEGVLDIPKNAYAQGRDFYQAFVASDYFKAHLADKTLHVVITKDFKFELKIIPNMVPPFFTSEDFEVLTKFAKRRKAAGDPETTEANEHLKKTYHKVEYWAQEVRKKAFPNGFVKIIKKPTNQGSVFEYYQWAKVYPSQETMNAKHLAYTLTISEDGFSVKIDTVGLSDNHPTRQTYFKVRGDYYNSPIVKIFDQNEVLSKSWNELINDSVKVINGLQDSYKRLLNELRILDMDPVADDDEDEIENEQIDLALNLILYGPPGTGKTRNLNNIRKRHFTDYNIKRNKQELLHETLVEYPFWKVLGAALYASKEPLSVAELVDQPIVKLRIKPSVKTPSKNLAWADLQSYADDESTQLSQRHRRSIKLFSKNKDSKWSISKDKMGDISSIIDETLLALATNQNRQGTESVQIYERHKFITFHQKYSYEDFIEGIKPVLRTDDEGDINEPQDSEGSLAFELKKGIFYDCCLKALNLAGYDSFLACYSDSHENRRQRFQSLEGITTKQYALFIDEINRANISAVFGELITLIEDSKRLGADEEIWVQLPYSNEHFGVPPNLYVIGSMNTADKSIALLDIALRRRFQFEGVYPNYESIPEWSTTLQALNRKIFDLKKSPDFFIGHSFFIKKSINDGPEVFNTKIIPLLMEYFQNNINTVSAILTEANIAIEPPTINNNFQIIALD